MKTAIKIIIGIWAILSLLAIDAAFTARSILYSYRAEIAYLKQQQEANQRDINSLHEQTYYLRELMRNAAKNQIPR